MKSLIFILLCLVFLHVHGQRDTASNSCKCKDGYIKNTIPRKLIKSQPEVYYANGFCTKIEIIITTIADEKRCVNPESKLGKLILSNKEKYDKIAAERMTTSSKTTTSSQTTTSSKTTTSSQTTTSNPSTRRYTTRL